MRIVPFVVTAIMAAAIVTSLQHGDSLLFTRFLLRGELTSEYDLTFSA